jgi:hypothetical protein
MVTRGTNQNWQIHPGWVDRYVQLYDIFNLFKLK